MCIAASRTHELADAKPYRTIVSPIRADVPGGGEPPLDGVGGLFGTPSKFTRSVKNPPFVSLVMRGNPIMEGRSIFDRFSHTNVAWEACNDGIDVLRAGVYGEDGGAWDVGSGTGIWD